ncbi:hypothetical protein [Mycoplasma capricolum]|uniref:hypothetical protein n=1 Tax=Mycoplasma capricolum TaxID=2095 RepID=UPI001FB57210|nr:hypothetical protein [Mycoplasma capricolum]
MYIFYFLTNNQELTPLKIILLGLYFLHLVSMSFAIVVNRGHWVSDVTFTYLWLLPLIFLTHFLSLKILVIKNTRNIVKKVKTSNLASFFLIDYLYLNKFLVSYNKI